MQLHSRKPVFEIDGTSFNDLQGFFEEVSRKLIPHEDWGHNLDAFDDILGGFGLPEGGFILRWKSSATSRERLGYAETARVLEKRLTRCHPNNVPYVQAELEAARRCEGPTIFDVLVSIIRRHGPEGDRKMSGVDLLLE